VVRDSRNNFPRHYNAAPGQELPVIRLHPESGDRVLACSVGPYPLAIGLVLDLPHEA